MATDANDIFDQVTAVYGWNQASQTWLGFFPAGVSVPGANDLTSLRDRPGLLDRHQGSEQRHLDYRDQRQLSSDSSKFPASSEAGNFGSWTF